MDVLVRQEIHQMLDQLELEQKTDGSWRYCFESGPMTDAYMILLLRALELEEPDVIRLLAARILSLQNDNGSWSLFHDEPNSGNLSLTVEAYNALVTSGYCNVEDEAMQRARRFIRESQRFLRIGISTRAMLACNGQIPWKQYKIPLVWTSFSRWSPISFYDFVGYARAHIAPVLIASTCNTSIRPPGMPDLKDLLCEQNLNKKQTLMRSGSSRNKIGRMLLSRINRFSLRKLERYLLERLESDGTLMGYASATFFMIYAFLGLGYTKNDPVIRQAVNGLKSLIYPLPCGAHLQNSTSTVWDTASISYAIQTTSDTRAQNMSRKAKEYLLSRQHTTPGDWKLRNAHAEAGGWGFSDINTITPDIDDTTAALRVMAKSAEDDVHTNRAFVRGLNWLMSMQNADGGWSAFERNTDKRILSNLVVDGARATLTDPSSADLTGRTLEFLGRYAGYTVKHGAVERAVNWLLQHQEADGSWYGRWGVCFIYGTWAALTGLIAVGVSPDHPSIRRGVDWLLRLQNPNGGWGESCISDTRRSYVPLCRSTISQTAWATDALITVFPERISAIEKGIAFLMKPSHPGDWVTSYPTGAGLPGGFYIHYHSYSIVWKLLALGHFQEKYHSPVVP